MDVLELLYNRFYDTLTDILLWLNRDIDANPAKVALWGGLFMVITLMVLTWHRRKSLREARGMGSFEAYKRIAEQHATIVQAPSDAAGILLFLTAIASVLITIIILYQG